MKKLLIICLLLTGCAYAINDKSKVYSIREYNGDNYKYVIEVDIRDGQRIFTNKSCTVGQLISECLNSEVK